MLSHNNCRLPTVNTNQWEFIYWLYAGNVFNVLTFARAIISPPAVCILLIVTTVFGCNIILRASYISSDLPLDKVHAMTMYILVGHYVQPSSWDYSPENEAIGWTHGYLGPTAESRQLLWIVHWFVLFLSDRRTDVSVVECLSCLTTATRIFFIRRTQSIYGHSVSVLQPQTETFAPAA